MYLWEGHHCPVGIWGWCCLENRPVYLISIRPNRTHKWKSCTLDERFSPWSCAQHVREARKWTKNPILRYELVSWAIKDCRDEKMTIIVRRKLPHCIRTILTYSSTQWPAVATQSSLMRAPPHRWVEENPKKDVLRTETCNKNKPENPK